MRVCSPSGRPHRLSRARGIGTRRLPLAGRLPGRGHRGTRATETPGGAVCRRIDGVSASVQSRFARPRPHLGVRYRGWTLSRDLSLRQSGRTGRLRTTGRRHLFKTVTRGGISRPETPARPQGVQALHPAPSPVLAGIGDGAPIPEARHIRCARRKAVKRRLPGLVDIDPHHANILTRTDKHRLRRPVNRPRLHRQRRFRQRGMRRLILAPGVRPGGAGQLLQTGAAKVRRGAERATTDLVRPSVSATWCRRSQAMHPGRFSGLGETGIGPAIETSKAAAFLPWSGKCSIPSSA